MTTAMAAGSTASATDQAGSQRVDIGGRCLALWRRGLPGAPTVVLETGLGAESAEWDAVERGIERFAAVCRYDRAARGASDRAPQPRSAADLVDDLHVLLQRSNVPGPYVLVGQSLGGLLVRLYAHSHRGEVAGLVLVDSMHEDQFDIFGPHFPPASPNEPKALTDIRTFWTRGWRDPTSTAEGIDFVASRAQAKTVVPLGALPLQVLTAGTFLNMPFVPDQQRPLLQQQWDRLQREFMRLSTRAERTVVLESGHFMQRDRPQSIVDAIERTLSQARSNGASMLAGPHANG